MPFILAKYLIAKNLSFCAAKSVTLDTCALNEGNQPRCKRSSFWSITLFLGLYALISILNAS